MSEPAYERLRAAILSLELTPGERVSERGLEPDLGASRTPIRAALQRLQSEGLVLREERGWRVAPIDLAQLSGLYELRQIVEPAAARLAAIRASDEGVADLARLSDTLRADDSPEHSVDAGTDFHLAVVRLAGNDALTDSVEHALTRLYRTRWLVVQTPESRAEAHREHDAIAAALAARDADAAESATLEHLRATGERLTESLEAGAQRLRATGIALR